MRQAERQGRLPGPERGRPKPDGQCRQQDQQHNYGDHPLSLPRTVRHGAGRRGAEAGRSASGAAMCMAPEALPLVDVQAGQEWPEKSGGLGVVTPQRH